MPPAPISTDGDVVFACFCRVVNQFFSISSGHMSGFVDPYRSQSFVVPANPGAGAFAKWRGKSLPIRGFPRFLLVLQTGFVCSISFCSPFVCCKPPAADELRANSEKGEILARFLVVRPLFVCSISLASLLVHFVIFSGFARASFCSILFVRSLFVLLFSLASP